MSGDAGIDAGVLEEVEQAEEVKEPRSYKVLLHNDDITTMEFVVDILRRIFHKKRADAEAIMLKVHRTGIGVCGIYTREVAETRVNQVIRAARDAGFPLKCTMEEI